MGLQTEETASEKALGQQKKCTFEQEKPHQQGYECSAQCAVLTLHTRVLCSFSSSELFQIGEGARSSNPR